MNQFSRTLLILVSIFGGALAGGADALAAAPLGKCQSLFRSSSQSLSVAPSAELGPTELIPSDVIVRKMNPRRVIVSEVRPSQEWTESMEKIRSALQQLKHPLKGYDQAVIYPMSGFDLATPLILFPKAQTYILIDNHSLMRPYEISDFLKRRVELDYVDRNSDWVRFDRTGADIFPRLMTALYAHAPKTEIVAIEFYIDAVENVSAKIVVRTMENSSVDSSAKEVEKTIWYLVGEVGHVDREAKVDAESHRSYMSQREKPYRDFGPPWWGPLVDQIAPRTLILKGSMSGLRPARHDNPLPGRERLLAPLLRDGGLIVEGSSPMDQYHDADWAKTLDPKRTRWEFTDGDSRFKVARASAELRNVEFSYARNVRIGFYDPVKK